MFRRSGDIAGAAVYAVRRPNPWPRVFGFHEVFHGLVVAGALTHFVTMAAWIVPAQPERAPLRALPLSDDVSDSETYALACPRR